MTGIVTRSTGSWYSVMVNHEVVECRVRGKIRLDDIKESNPVAVGDEVELEDWNGSYAITRILPRKNHMLRQSVKRSAHSSVLAANVDQALLVATPSQPRTSLGFIDRFLVSAEAFRIPQILVFNKIDLLDGDALRDLHDWRNQYNKIGITVRCISVQQNNGVDEIKSLLSGKTTLIAGHSGVGKSSLLNALSPGIQQTVGELSSFSDKGMHTTTFAERFALGDNTFVIDTPGIKEWGLVDMNEQELSDYFPEMRDLRPSCKFGRSCLHVQEPQCAVKVAVENGSIWSSRYNSYLSMISGKDNRK